MTFRGVLQLVGRTHSRSTCEKSKTFSLKLVHWKNYNKRYISTSTSKACASNIKSKSYASTIKSKENSCGEVVQENELDDAADDADHQRFVNSCKAYLGYSNVDKKETKSPFWLRNSEEVDKSMSRRYNTVNNMLESYLSRSNANLETALEISQFLLGSEKKMKGSVGHSLLVLLEDTIRDDLSRSDQADWITLNAMVIFNSVLDHEKTPCLLNTLVNVLHLTEKLDQASPCVSYLLDLGISPSSSTFITLLKYNHHEPTEHGRTQISKVLCELRRSNVDLKGELLDLILGHMNEANVRFIWDLYRRNRTKNNLSSKSYYKFIRSFCHAGSMDYPYSVYLDMKRAGYEANQAVYSTLIRHCCIVRLPNRAYELFLDMKKLGYVPDIRTYSGLIFALSKVGDVSTAELVFDEMMIKKDVKSTQLCTALMTSYLYDKQFEKGMALFERMKSMDLELDSVAYAVAINLCFALKSTEKALEIHQEMLSCNMQPDLSVYHALIYGLFTHGQIEASLQMFSDMQFKGIQPDATTYTMLMNLFGGKRDIDQVHELYQEAMHRQIEPTFKMLIALMNHIKNADVVRNLMGEEVYTKLIRHCSSRNSPSHHPLMKQDDVDIIDIRGHTKDIALSVFFDYLRNIQMLDSLTDFYKDLVVITGKTGIVATDVVQFLKDNKLEHTTVAEEGYILIPSSAVQEYAHLLRHSEEKSTFHRLLAIRYGTIATLILTTFAVIPNFYSLPQYL